MSYNGTVRCSHCYTTGHNKRKCPGYTEMVLRRYNDNLGYAAAVDQDDPDYYLRQAERYRLDYMKRTKIDPATGEQDWWIEQLPGESPGDGFAFDVDGRLYCACPMDHCIRVFDTDGKQVELIDLGDGAYPTNCCFGGADRRTLFTTELAPGRVCVVEGLPTPGLELNLWPTP